MHLGSKNSLKLIFLIIILMNTLNDCTAKLVDLIAQHNFLDEWQSSIFNSDLNVQKALTNELAHKYMRTKELMLFSSKR